MTPDQAIAVLGETRHYRETLTSRAVGIIWLVWGVVLAMLVASDLAFVMAMEAGAVENNNAILGIATVLVVVGAAMTNLVWRAHALETDPRPRPWLAYVVAGGLVLGAAVLLPMLDTVFYDPLDLQSPTRLSTFLLLALDGALAIGIILRRHVSILPALVAAAAMLVMHGALLAIDVPRTVATDFWYGLGVMLDILVVFGLVGAWHHLRG